MIPRKAPLMLRKGPLILSLSKDERTRPEGVANFASPEGEAGRSPGEGALSRSGGQYRDRSCLSPPGGDERAVVASAYPEPLL